MSATEKGIAIMKKLEQLQHQYKEAGGVELLVGGYDSYIYSDKYYNLAQKHHFIKGDSFDIDDDEVISKVEDYISNNRMVILVAWTDKERIDLYLERI
jgi:hypothetical protein